MSTHTPGPWTLTDNRMEVIAGDAAKFNVIAMFLKDSPDGVLIAAAPDLLAACKEAQRELAALGHTSSYLPKAIARARGES